MATAYYSDTNGVPKDGDGRVTHLGLSAGELAPRVVSVGSLSRAQRLRDLMDSVSLSLTSPRGFTTYTGTVAGVAVSVVATGMGAPMMDFCVREARQIVDGPMVFVRLGSCGGLSPEATPGTVVLNTPGSVYVSRNPDAFAGGEGGSTPAYTIARPVAPDPRLCAHVCVALRAALGDRVVEGLNASADSFYAAQGRCDEHFDDRNSMVVPEVLAKHPDACSMEMESFALLHLAACSLGTIRACTAAIVAANRHSAAVITTELLHETERVGGRAVLNAVASFGLYL